MFIECMFVSLEYVFGTNSECVSVALSSRKIVCGGGEWEAWDGGYVGMRRQCASLHQKYYQRPK